MTNPESSPISVLVVEDDESMRALLGRWLAKDGVTVHAAGSGEAAIAGLGRTLPDAICMDVELPGIDGIATLRTIRETHPSLPIIVMTGNAAPETIVLAMQHGAYDYLVKPLDATRVVTTVRHAAQTYRASLRLLDLERQASGGDAYHGMVGRSPAMRALFRTLDRVADREVSVLVHGESGTGKELVARAIHDRSARRKGPFVAVNCAAVPESMQEAELFGHERGAFTGAVQRRAGLFERANGGTLFLDEVAELSPRLQAQLLRVLEERRFMRLGGTEELRTDFRLVSASHAALEDEIAAGRFREDLYFRIAVFDLELPALRDRLGDVAMLARKFVADRAEGRDVRLADEALHALETYRWPGNVRELRNAIERALVVCDDGVLRVEHLPGRIRRTPDAPRPAEAARAGSASEALPPADAPPAGATLEQLERRALEEALEACDWNVPEVVRRLGIGRTTVYRKIKEYGLVPKRGG